MVQSNDDIKRAQFLEILFELANSQELLSDPKKRSDYFKRLEDFYCIGKNERYRHYYTDIFSVLSEISQDSNLGSIDILSQNLLLLRNGYKVISKSRDISGCLRKLYDHVNLEVARLAYSDAKERELSQQSNIEDIRSKVNEFKANIDNYDARINGFNDSIDAFASKMAKYESDINQYETKLAKATRKMNDAQKEYIAILGIFASIVLTFVGGMAFSTSVLQNIDAISIYRLLFTIDLLAFVLINTVNVLLKFIWRLHDKDIEGFPCITWINVVCLVFAIVVVIAWAVNFEHFPNFIHDFVSWCCATKA